MMIDPGLEFSNTRDRTGETRLWVNGELWDNYAQAQTVEFQEDAGGSRLTFTSRAPLDRTLGRKVELYVGTDEGFEPIFTGRLIRPMPTPATFTSSAAALGPFSQMADQSFRFPVSYATTFVRDALKDICKRAGYAQGVPIIGVIENQQIEDLIFAEEAKLLEGAEEVCKVSDLVMTDTGGGNRLFLPRPAPGGGNNTRTLYTESDYKTFDIEEEWPNTFAEVAVLRRSSDSDELAPIYEVEARRPVPQPYDGVPAPANRIMYITDFAGSQRQAEKAAYDTARRAGLHGEINWTMTELPLAPVQRYTSIQGRRDIEYTDGWYRELYDLTIHDGVTYDIPAWQMTLGGKGMLLSSEKIAPQRIEVNLPATGAIL
jgi:hypothetical protein